MSKKKTAGGCEVTSQLSQSVRINSQSIDVLLRRVEGLEARVSQIEGRLGELEARKPSFWSLLTGG